MIRRIHADIFFQDRYILNEVNVKIKLIRSRDSFLLMETGAQHYQKRYFIHSKSQTEFGHISGAC